MTTPPRVTCSVGNVGATLESANVPMWIQVTVSSNVDGLVWADTGDPFPDVAQTFPIDESGVTIPIGSLTPGAGVTFDLIPTDLEGWLKNGLAVDVSDGKQTHLYTATVAIGMGLQKIKTLTYANFVVPAATVGVIDLDKVAGYTGSSGGTVAIPDLAAIAAAAEAARDEAQAIALGDGDTILAGAISDGTDTPAALVTWLAAQIADNASGIATALAAKLNVSLVGVANGVATLDSSGHIPAGQLPVSAVEFKGVWNASTNSPTLVDGTGNSGDFWRVGTGGTQNLGSGSQTFVVGDQVWYDGSVWQRSHGGPDSVQSVAGKTGAVTLVATDITDATAAGRALMTAADATAQKTALAITQADVSGLVTALAGKASAAFTAVSSPAITNLPTSAVAAYQRGTAGTGNLVERIYVATLSGAATGTVRVPMGANASPANFVFGNWTLINSSGTMLDSGFLADDGGGNVLLYSTGTSQALKTTGFGANTNTLSVHVLTRSS